MGPHSSTTPTIEVKMSPSLKRVYDIAGDYVVLTDHHATLGTTPEVLDPESNLPKPLDRNMNPITRVHSIHC